MIYDHRRDSHDSLPSVLLYACPNINARYKADSISATRWTGEFPFCAACGKSHGSFAVHHEPPRSKGSLLLRTRVGEFVVKPTLILLCGECHADRHEGRLSFAWEFDHPDFEEAFLSGEFFKAGHAEHDERFWLYGRLLMERGGRRWEVRA